MRAIQPEMSPESIRMLAVEHINRCHHNIQKCYTDGAKMCDGRVGGVLVIDDGTEGSFRLSDNTSICSAELTAINESIKIAEERGIERLAIFSDSARALRSLQEGTSADHPALLNDIFVVLESVQNRGF